MLSVALQITEIKMLLSDSSPQLSLCHLFFFCFCPIYDSALFIFQHCNIYRSPQLQSTQNTAASNSDGAPYLFGIKDSLQGERSLVATVSVAAGGGSLALRFCPPRAATHLCSYRRATVSNAILDTLSRFAASPHAAICPPGPVCVFRDPRC